MQFSVTCEGGPRHGERIPAREQIVPAEGGSYRLEITERFGFPVRYVWQPGTVQTVTKAAPMTDEEIDASVRRILKQ